MGLYNLVDFEISCPHCGSLVKNFQTKDGDNMLITVEFTSVDNFYAICSHCQTFVEFSYYPKKTERDIDDYKMRIIQLGKNGNQ